jgi:hypothetical protein
MTRTADQIEKCMRWYPSAWRVRYGEELAVLSEDVYGGNGLPRGDRISLVGTGLQERARSVGLLGDSRPPAQRVRSASLVVLCGWAAFMVAGAVFAKFSEHWTELTPAPDRGVPGTGYSVVLWAGTVGGLVVLVSLLLALPAFVRHVRDGGWSAVRRPILRSVVAGLSMVALTAGLAEWAHHLSEQARNGGSVPYEVAFALWAVGCVTALAIVTWSGVAVATQLPFAARTLRASGLMAVALTVAMAFVVGGLLVWWISLAEHAPHALNSGNLATGTVVPPALLASGTLMAGALACAVLGSSKVLTSLRSVGASEAAWTARSGSG